MKLLERVGLLLAASVLVLMLLLLWQNLLLSHHVLSGSSAVEVAQEQKFMGMIEAKLIELTFAILVVFSIAATLFSYVVKGRLDRFYDVMTEKAKAEVVAVAEAKVRNSAVGVTANIFHELAFLSGEKIDSVVERKFQGEAVDEYEMEAAITNLTLGLHYAMSGLGNLSDFTPSELDQEVSRRVPGHLINTFLWLSAAKIILTDGVENRSYYDLHLRYVEDLIEFLLDKNTPSRPHWYQGYESCGFFLLALSKKFNDNDLKNKGLELLKEATSGGLIADHLEQPPSVFCQKTISYYNKADYTW